MLTPSPSIDLMIQKQEFQAAVFLLSLYGKEVASITYDATTAFDSVPTAITNTTRSIGQILPLSKISKSLPHPIEDTSTTRIQTADTTNDLYLRVNFQLTGSMITIWDIFYMAIDMLLELAVYAQAARFADFTMHLNNAHLVVSTQQSSPPSTVHNPLYFRMEWLMRALAETPAYMLEQRSFKEVDMTVFANEVEVGKIFIKRPRTATGLVQGFSDDNAATA